MTKHEELLKDIENYADSIDDDCNTIQNYDMSCCDAREHEALRCVFNVLDRMIKKHRNDSTEYWDCCECGNSYREGEANALEFQCTCGQPLVRNKVYDNEG